MGYAIEQLLTQRFCCYVSGIPFSSPCEMSLERMDEERGYTTDNCQFIHRFFQRFHNQPGEMQWTPAKFQAVLDFRLDPHDDGSWRQEVKRAREWKGRKNGVKCPALVRLYGRFAQGWRQRTAERNKKRQKQQKQQLPDPDVTEEQFVDLYEEQKGLYAYLGFPLRLDVQSIGWRGGHRLGDFTGASQ